MHWLGEKRHRTFQEPVPDRSEHSLCNYLHKVTISKLSTVLEVVPERDRGQGSSLSMRR